MPEQIGCTLPVSMAVLLASEVLCRMAKM